MTYDALIIYNFMNAGETPYINNIIKKISYIYIYIYTVYVYMFESVICIHRNNNTSAA